MVSEIEVLVDEFDEAGKKYDIYLMSHLLLQIRDKNELLKDLIKQLVQREDCCPNKEDTIKHTKFV